MSHTYFFDAEPPTNKLLVTASGFVWFRDFFVRTQDTCGNKIVYGLSGVLGLAQPFFLCERRGCGLRVGPRLLVSIHKKQHKSRARWGVVVKVVRVVSWSKLESR